MNIKTTLVLAATALALFAAPASARTNGSAGWASAFPYTTGGHVDHPSQTVAPRYHALQR